MIQHIIKVYKSGLKKCTKPWVKGQVESGFWPCLAFMAFENEKKGLWQILCIRGGYSLNLVEFDPFVT